MADQQTRVQITANAAQAKAELDSFAARARAASELVKGSFGGIAAATIGLKGQLAGLGTTFLGIGIVAGTRHQLELMDAMRKSAQAAGVTVEAYSELAYAGKLADVEAETLTKTLARLSQDVIKVANGDRQMRALFEDTLRIKVRGATGELRTSDMVLGDLADRFASMDDGVKKTAIAIDVFGEKLGPRLIPFLNQGSTAITQLREEARRLGLTVSEETAAQAEEFNDNITRLGQAAAGVGRIIAADLLPPLVDLSKQLVDARSKSDLLRVIWENLKGNTAFDDLSLKRKELEHLNFSIQSTSAQLDAMLRAQQEYPNNTAYSEHVKTLRTDLERLMREAASASEALKQLADQKAPPSQGAGAGRGIINPPAARPRTPFDPDIANVGGARADTRMQQWEAALDKQKVAHEQQQAEAGTFYEFGQEREAAYWQAVLATLGAGDEQRLAVQKKYYGLVLAMRKGDFDAEQAELQTRLDGAKGSYAEQEALADAFATNARERYGRDSKEYQAALKQLQGVYRAHGEALRQIDAIRADSVVQDQLEEVAAIERTAQQRFDLGLMTEQQLLQVRLKALQQRAAIELQAKEEEKQAAKDDPLTDPVALEKLEAELAAIRRRYRGQIDEAKGQIANAQVREGGFEAFFGTSQQVLTQGLQSAVANMKITLSGLKDVARQVGTSLITELAIKPVSEMAVGFAKSLLMAVMFGEERVAVEGATAAQIAGIQAALSLKSIAMSAAEAAASTYKAIAAIPYVGPFLAPAAAAASLAAVMALGSRIFSAEGGFDIPAGVNPMVQTHAREMILPAKHADVIRGLADGTLRGGGGGPPVVLKNASVGEFVILHRREFAKAFKTMKRDFAFER